MTPDIPQEGWQRKCERHDINGERFVPESLLHAKDQQLRELVEGELANNEVCSAKGHNKPRDTAASDYDCADIHIGREEMGSDILEKLKATN